MMKNNKLNNIKKINKKTNKKINKKTNLKIKKKTNLEINKINNLATINNIFEIIFNNKK